MTDGTAIRVTKHHHACVIVDDGATRILVDPGTLGPPVLLDGIDAVLISHRHTDHLDPDLIARAVEQSIPVWAPADALEDLGDHHRIREAVAGDSFTVGSLTVQVAGDRHAEVHPHIAGPLNRAYLIGGAVFVTGDEHPIPPGPFTALVTPIDAPWLRATDLIRYVHTLAPDAVIGVHDGLLNQRGRDVAHHSARTLVNEGAVSALVPDDGATVEVPKGE